MDKINNLLNRQFRMKDMGKISWFLGIKSEQGNGYITMNQTRLFGKQIEEIWLRECKTKSNSMCFRVPIC